MKNLISFGLSIEYTFKRDSELYTNGIVLRNKSFLLIFNLNVFL